MMTLDEMKLAVCEKLPGLIIVNIHDKSCFWRDVGHDTSIINWPTEGLQVCHEAEKLLVPVEMVLERREYVFELMQLVGVSSDMQGKWSFVQDFALFHATYEQRLGCLCRVWWPERSEQ